MPCNCTKRQPVQQPVIKKAPIQPTTQRVTTGRRIVHKIIR